MCSVPAWERSRLARAASGLQQQQPEELVQARQRLLAHLQTSSMWDPAPVLHLLQGTDLWREQVAVHQRVSLLWWCLASSCAGHVYTEVAMQEPICSARIT